MNLNIHDISECTSRNLSNFMDIYYLNTGIKCDLESKNELQPKKYFKKL